MMIVSLLSINSVAHSNELDELISASSALASKIDRGIMISGSAMEWAHTGTGISDGNLHFSAQISVDELDAYNAALAGMSTFLPYGSVQTQLEEMAQQELNLLDEAVDVFTDVVIDLSTTIQVSELSEQASTPDEQAEVQEFVVQNQEALMVTEEDISTYNQSIESIEEHANSASVYMSVAANEEAVGFLQQSVENANTTAEQTNIFYDANAQWLVMGYPTTRNLTAVYLNGQNFGLDLYLTDAEILAAGAESEYYLTGPTALGYKCFMTFEDCE